MFGIAIFGWKILIGRKLCSASIIILKLIKTKFRYLKEKANTTKCVHILFNSVSLLMDVILLANIVMLLCINKANCSSTTVVRMNTHLYDSISVQATGSYVITIHTVVMSETLIDQFVCSLLDMAIFTSGVHVGNIYFRCPCCTCQGTKPHEHPR